ncbi:MAG: DUF6503 family protein [Bacteroidota bacterium]
MKTLFILLGLSVLLFAACSSKTLSSAAEQKSIIARTIEAHGGQRYDTAAYTFEFRGRNYTFQQHQEGSYHYSRTYQKEEKRYEETLTNVSFSQKVDGQLQELSDKDALRFGNALNSVIYFALLPYKLEDPAVRQKEMGTVTIKGKPYRVVEVRFVEEGGGTDHEDIFYYWLDQETYIMDYLAYTYHVNGGGVRFRSAYNPRIVDGIRFQDYINYKAPKDTPLASLPQLFEAGQLKELSRIELKNVRGLPTQ